MDDQISFESNPTLELCTLCPSEVICIHKMLLLFNVKTTQLEFAIITLTETHQDVSQPDYNIMGETAGIQKNL